VSAMALACNTIGVAAFGNLMKFRRIANTRIKKSSAKDILLKEPNEIDRLER
jgi:hypothetical protein